MMDIIYEVLCILCIIGMGICLFSLGRELGKIMDSREDSRKNTKAENVEISYKSSKYTMRRITEEASYTQNLQILVCHYECYSIIDVTFEEFLDLYERFRKNIHIPNPHHTHDIMVPENFVVPSMLINVENINLQEKFYFLFKRSDECNFVWSDQYVPWIDEKFGKNASHLEERPEPSYLYLTLNGQLKNGIPKHLFLDYASFKDLQ